MRAFSSTAARSIRTTAVRGFRTTAVTQERCADQTMAFGPSLGDLGTALMRFGPRLFVRKMMMFNGEMKLGSLIGVDEFGNEYFENTAYPYPRHRWVEYAGLPWTQNCDASDIGAEWHGWLHNMTDQIPATVRLPRAQPTCWRYARALPPPFSPPSPSSRTHSHTLSRSRSPSLTVGITTPHPAPLPPPPLPHSTRQRREARFSSTAMRRTTIMWACTAGTTRRT